MKVRNRKVASKLSGVNIRLEFAWYLLILAILQPFGRSKSQGTKAFVLHHSLSQQTSLSALENDTSRGRPNSSPATYGGVDDTSELYPLFHHIRTCEPELSEAVRIFHGRGGLFPGCEHITLDWFPPVWLLTSHNQEIGPQQLGSIKENIQRRNDALQPPRTPDLNLVYQHRSNTNATTTLLAGSLPIPHIVTESGMRFLVRLDRARNHGIFLDMANGRQWIRGRAKGKHVLNLFAYTCGFSVAALYGGAESVVNMDMVNGVLKTGQRNHEINGLTANGTARFLAHDIFKSWGKIRKLGPYDIIIIDPPSFQRNSFVAKKDYGKLIRRLPGLLTVDGHAMLCLNAPELETTWLQDWVNTEAPELTFVERLDNPSSFDSSAPERALKVLIYKLHIGSC